MIRCIPIFYIFLLILWRLKCMYTLLNTLSFVLIWCQVSLKMLHEPTQDLEAVFWLPNENSILIPGKVWDRRVLNIHPYSSCCYNYWYYCRYLHHSTSGSQIVSMGHTAEKKIKCLSSLSSKMGSIKL